MVGLPRSGSTNIYGWISNQMDFDNFEIGNEPFNNIMIQRESDVSTTLIERVARITATDCWVIKSHIRHLHFLSDNYPDLWKTIKTTENVNWFRLLRRDIFASALSFNIAIHSQEWARYTDTEMINITVDEFSVYLHKVLQHNYNLILNRLDIPYNFTIFYEDGFKDVLHKQFSLDPYVADYLQPAPSKQSRVSTYNILKEYALDVICNHELLNNVATIKKGIITHVDFVHTC